MRKKIFIGLIMLFVFTALVAQNNYKADKRLYEVFSSDYISQLEASKSELIPYYNFYLDNSYLVVDLKSASKEVTGVDIHIIKSIANGTQPPQSFNEISYSKETFNVLKYNFDLSSNSFITYIWKEAGKALVFKPLPQIAAEYKFISKQQ